MSNSIYGRQDQVPSNRGEIYPPNRETYPPNSYPNDSRIDNIISDEQSTRGTAIAGLVLVLIFGIAVGILVLGIFLDWWGSKFTSEKSETIIEKGQGLNAHFNSLKVNNNTILGDSTNDRLTVKAEIEGDLVPDGKTRNLGSGSQSWDVLYVDDIQMENGASIMSTGTDEIFIDGHLKYRSNVKDLPLTDGVTTNINKSDSGSIYQMHPTNISEAGVSVYLPDAEGSGRRYEFIATEDIYTVRFLTENESKIYGMISVVSEPENQYSPVQGGVSSALFTTTDDNYEVFVDIERPYLGGDPMAANIRKGSRFNFVDYTSEIWSVDGNIIIDSGASSGDMVTPFNSAVLL